MENTDDRTEALVLGIGNLLWADEGFGVRAVEEFHRRYSFPEGVVLMDGGTQGLYLVHHVTGARRLIVFDAIDYDGLEPGALKLVRDDEVPRFTGARKLSLHQTGFQDVLSAAGLIGQCPDEMLLIGVQAVDLEEWGGNLTPLVHQRIEPAIEAAIGQLAVWGIEARVREVPLPPGEGLVGNGIDLDSFECGKGS